MRQDGIFHNAVTFVPLRGAKVLALLAASHAQHGIVGHLIQREAGHCPLALPPHCPNFSDLVGRVFDTLTKTPSCSLQDGVFV